MTCVLIESLVSWAVEYVWALTLAFFLVKDLLREVTFSRFIWTLTLATIFIKLLRISTVRKILTETFAKVVVVDHPIRTGGRFAGDTVAGWPVKVVTTLTLSVGAVNLKISRGLDLSCFSL